MMDGVTELAKMFKERNQKSWSGIQVGTIIRVSPLEIRLNEHRIIYSDKLTQSTTFANRTKQTGQRVIILPTSDEQKYYAIDTAVV